MAKPKIILMGRQHGKAMMQDQIYLMNAMRTDGPIKVQTIKTRDTTVENYTMNTRFDIGTLKFDPEAAERLGAMIHDLISSDLKKSSFPSSRDDLVDKYDID